MATTAPFSVNFAIGNNWGNGFTGGMSLLNTGSAINGWTLTFDAPFTITNIWNAEIVSRVGNRYTIRNLSWNATIPTNGKVDFGFNTSYPSGTSAASLTPTNYSVNGTALTPIVTPPTTLPQLSIANLVVTEGDNGTQIITFQASLSQARTTAVTVDYGTVDGTAKAGSDYQAATGRLTFNPGETTKTISVVMVNDRLNESQESFLLRLSNVVGATLPRTDITATINDNDPVTPTPVRPTITVGNASITEGNSGNQSLLFTATLNQATTQPVTFQFTTQNGTATAGSDYLTTSGTLTFAAGTTSQTFSIPIVGDTTVESQESFSVLLSNALNGTLAQTSATGTILDNDTPVQPPSTGRFNYGEALQKSFLFYEAQRSGDLPTNKRIDWRQDSALRDRSDVGRDLSGGYYDAGDHVKFAFPMAGSMTMLNWGIVEYRAAYQRSGQLDEALDSVRWGLDWLLKAHQTDNDLNPTRTVALWGQVGDGNVDHAYWGSPEAMTMARPAYKIDWANPGTDLAAESAAALASGSLAFRATDPAYADRLLKHARVLYDFADQAAKKKYSDSITAADAFYRSWNGYNDELGWGAAWLYKATGEQQYLAKAEQYFALAGVSQNWTHGWDYKGNGTGILLAQLTGKESYKQNVEGWLNWWSDRSGNGIAYTAGGLAWLTEWGSLRYSANTAFLAGMYSDTVRDTSDKRYSNFANGQIDYILGNNPRNQSYMVGFGSNFPKNPHHRAASGTTNINDPLPNRNIIYGALVGGPSAPNDNSWSDSRTNYVANEVGLDYNAGFTGALVRQYNQFGGNPLTDSQLDALTGITITP